MGKSHSAVVMVELEVVVMVEVEVVVVVSGSSFPLISTEALCRLN